MIYRRRMSGMGELTTTITVDPVVLNGQATNEQGSVITGDPVPVSTSWLPLIIVAGALGLVWWLSNDDDEEEGDDDERPFGE